MNHVPFQTAATVAPIPHSTVAKNVADCARSVADLKEKCVEVQETSGRLAIPIPDLELHQFADDIARVRRKAEEDVEDLRSDFNKVGAAVDATIASLDEGFKDPSVAADKKGLSADTLEWGPKTIKKIAGRMSESSRSLTFRVALELSQAPDFLQTLASKTAGVLESDARAVEAAKKEARDNKRELKAQKEEVTRLLEELKAAQANVEGLSAEIAGLKDANTLQSTRIEQLEAAQIGHENTVQNLSDERDTLSGRVGRRDQTITTLNAGIRARDTDIKRLQGEVKEREGRMRKNDDDVITRDALREERDTKRMQLHANEVKELRTRLQNAAQEATLARNALVQKHVQEMDALKQGHDQEMEDFKVKVRKFYSDTDVERVKGLKEKYSAKVDALEKEHSAKVKGLEGGYAAKVEALEQGHSAKVDALEKEHSAKVKALEGEHAAKVKGLEGGYSSKVDALEKEHSAKLNGLEGEHAAKVNELKDNHVTNVEELTSARDEEAAKLAALKEKHTADVEKLTRAYNAEVRARAQETAKVAALEEKHGADVEKLTRAYNGEVAKVAALTRARDEETAKVAALEEKHANDVAYLTHENADKLRQSEKEVVATIVAGLTGAAVDPDLDRPQALVQLIRTAEQVPKRAEGCHWQIVPSSVPQGDTRRDVEGVCLEMVTLMDHTADPKELCQVAGKLSGALNSSETVNFALVHKALQVVLEDLHRVEDRDDMGVSDFGWLLVGLAQAIRDAGSFGDVGGLEAKVMEWLGGKPPIFAKLASEMQAGGDSLRRYCQAVGHVWDDPDAGLIGYRGWEVFAMDFASRRVQHLGVDCARQECTPTSSVLYLTTPGGGQSLGLPLTFEQSKWWAQGCPSRE